MPSGKDFATAQELLRPTEACDVELGHGIRTLAQQLTPSHSLTSRRYAVWPIIRSHVDPPCVSYMQRQQHFDIAHLIQRVPPSYWGRGPPPRKYAQCNPIGMSTGQPATIRPMKTRRNAAEIQEIDWLIANLEKWENCIQHTVNSLNHSTSKTVNCCRFRASLISLLCMVSALKLFRPRRGTHPLFDGQLPDKLTRPQPVTYCTLCWRLTLRSEKMQQAKQPVPPDAGIRRLSNRYCAEHNPSDPRSRYWTDRLYREAFERELAALSDDHTVDMQQARKLAYERAHVRKPQPKRSLERHKKIRELLAKGMTQAEIARRLGVSRQAVGKVVRGNG